MWTSILNFIAQYGWGSGMLILFITLLIYIIMELRHIHKLLSNHVTDTTKKIDQQRQDFNQQFIQQREDLKQQRQDFNQQFIQQRQDFNQQFIQQREDLKQQREDFKIVFMDIYKKFDQQRQEFNQKFDQQRQDFNQQFNQQRQDFNSKFLIIEEDLREIRKDIKELIKSKK